MCACVGVGDCAVAAGEVAGLEEPLEIPICAAVDLPMVLTSVAQDKERYGVLVDFSAPDAVMENYKQAIAFGIRPIIGSPPSPINPRGAERLQRASRALFNSAGCSPKVTGVVQPHAIGGGSVPTSR
jgi:dihydrodipicolinate reductase